VNLAGYPRLACCGLTGIVKLVRSAEEEREFHREGARALVRGLGLAALFGVLALLLSGCAVGFSTINYYDAQEGTQCRSN
jgi:hypothetical protein